MTQLSHFRFFFIGQLLTCNCTQFEDLDRKIVLLYFGDHLDGLLWLWTVISAGAVPCILPPLTKAIDQRKKDLQYLNTLLNNPLVITSESLLQEFRSMEGIRIVSASHIGSLELEAPVDQAPPGAVKEGNDLAILMLTSGSTGNAKAVCLKHSQILRSLQGKSKHHGTYKKDVFLNWIGLDHVANLTEIHLHAMSLSAQQVHIPSTQVLADPITFLSHITNYKVSYTFAPNFFLASLGRIYIDPSERERFNRQPKLNLKSMRALVSGGELNVVDTCTLVATIFWKYGSRREDFIRPGFGMTETCGKYFQDTIFPDIEALRIMEHSKIQNGH
jgi:acyl-CoA synthetase (AMP-forming)/AMP-acid ligase II